MLETILQNWSIENIESIKKIETGLLNQTYIVKTKSELYVLQRLHRAVSLPGCINNYFHVARFLHDQKYITQLLLPTSSNKLVFTQDNFSWRLLKGVPGNVYTVTPSEQIAYEAGRTLANFHVSLNGYQDELEETLPMFRYKSVLDKLFKYETNFLQDNNPKVTNTYKILKENLPKLLLPTTLPQSIIHTDPKISNFLFDDQGYGICMIDLDTIQKLSPLYDIGDCVRSICGLNEDNPNNTFNYIYYQAIINGYSQNNPLFSDRETSLIPQACQLVMLGLAARFLNDYIDDNYFGWDETRYESRKEHNLARCLGQIALWQSFTNQT